MFLRRMMLGAALLLAAAACANGESAGAGAAATGVVAQVTPAAPAETGTGVETAGATAAPTATATPGATPTPTLTPTATPVPTGPVTVCMGREPLSLYLYGPADTAADVVREVVYDGPIDTRGFAYQPVILEKIPSLADGDAAIEGVEVTEGDMVVDAAGNVVPLRPGVSVRPAGCFQEGCAVTFVAEAGEGAAGDEAATTVAGSVTMDQLAVTFTLLPDLTWSDGEPLTAGDSVFSFAVAQEAQIPPRQRTGLQGVVPARRVDVVARTASYTAEDERTVRWVGLPGFLDPYYQGNFFTPLPRHQLADMSAGELLEAEESAHLPLGWGPYVLTEWVPGERIVAERNPNYFRAAEGLPTFDQVIFRFPSGDPEHFIDDLAEGTCDVVTQSALTADWQRYRMLHEEGMVVLQTAPGTVWEHLDVGINPVPQYDWRGDIFEDPRLRQAIAYCVDREAIMNEVMAGLSVVPDAYIPPAHPLAEAAALTHYPYDPAAGLALLAEAGWRDTNGDGIAEAYGVPGLENGTLLTFNYVRTASELRLRIAEMVVEDLAACNMRVNLEAEPVPGDLYFAASADSPLFGRIFDMASFAWFADALPPCHLYQTEEIPALRNGWSGSNVTGYSNEAYDAACAAAQGAVPGMDAYRDNHLEALRIFNAELPAVPLFVHLRGALARPGLEGLIVDPTQPAETWNIEHFREAE